MWSRTRTRSTRLRTGRTRTRHDILWAGAICPWQPGPAAAARRGARPQAGVLGLDWIGLNPPTTPMQCNARQRNVRVIRYQAKPPLRMSKRPRDGEDPGSAQSLSAAFLDAAKRQMFSDYEARNRTLLRVTRNMEVHGGAFRVICRVYKDEDAEESEKAKANTAETKEDTRCHPNCVVTSTLGCGCQGGQHCVALSPQHMSKRPFGRSRWRTRLPRGRGVACPPGELWKPWPRWTRRS